MTEPYPAVAGDVLHMTVGELPLAAARAYPRHTAVVAGDLRLDYRTFADRVARLADALRAREVGSGVRVAVLAHNCLAVLELHFAVAFVGATIVPLNTRFSTNELSGALADSETAVIFVSEELCPQLPADTAESIVFDQSHASGVTVYEALLAGHEPLTTPEPDPDPVADLFYTSGSTGRPKGVQLTHANVLTGAITCAAAVGLDRRSVWLHASPMFHLADAWAIWATTLAGATHVVERFDAQRTVDTLQREAVSHTLLVPTALELLAAKVTADQRPFDSMQAMLYGGSPIDERTYRRLADLGAPMFHTYGSTETSGCISVLRPDEHVRADGSIRLGTVGREVPMTQVVIVNDAGEEVGAGEIGEITVRSPNVMRGYHAAPELDTEAFSQGRYRTGDLGLRDEDGYIELRGRKKEMLISGGENIYPNEVELALREHPAIADVGVGGLPDVRWGQLITAVVVPKDGASIGLDEVRGFLAKRLASYKIPRAVFVVDELPRNGSGKIHRAQLQDLLTGLTKPGLDVAATPHARTDREERKAAMTAHAPEGFLADITGYTGIKWEVADTGIATLTLNRPQKLNAFDNHMLAEIRDVIWKASFDDSVRVVVVTGEGRGFCSGRDIAGLRMENALPSPQYRTYVRAAHETFDDLEAFEKPLIAAVNGVCAGGGVELAAACDIRIAAHEASFLLPETALGVLPASGACSRLTDMMGIGRLKEMVLTGDPIDAQEAHRIGLVNHVVAQDRLLAKANEIAMRILSRAPQAVGMAKHIINACRGLDSETGRLFERLGQSILITTDDAQRGMKAFEDKAKIRFEGR